MIKTFSYVAVILAVVSLAIGYALAGFWLGIVLAGVAGLLWLVGLWRGRRWIIGLSVVLFVGIAATGTWFQVSTGWLLFGIVAALAGWDLDDFAHRFGQTDQIRNYAALQRHHLQRLALIAGLGLLSGGFALNIELKLNIWWGIFLSTLVIVGLSQAIGRLRRESD